MNRLILVGNGFDLAHGLKTSYKDFIDDFWEDVIFKLNMFKSDTLLFSNEFIEISQDPFPTVDISNFKELATNYTTLKRFLSSKKIKFYFKNSLFRILSEINANQNWIDIENIYYKELKKFEFGRIRDYVSVDELNEDFEKIKFILVNYFKSINKNITLKKLINKHIQSIINLKDIESKYQKDIIKLIIKNTEIQNTNFYIDSSNSIKTFIKNIREQNNLEIEKFVRVQVEALGDEILDVMDLYPINSLILNFNYTSTTFNYIDEFNRINGNKSDYKISEIHIHGELNNPENPIIFGFGDDVDKKYQEFEDLNDNRYLENFKSIAYLQTDNYKKLLEFIDSEEYQVFIFGHSCGISDRTMLNTIFEHDNCKSIKPFYHKREDGTDNYTEIVQNISRNFNDKKKYRDRVVNKTYCEPLT